jgi:hypothetical protein
MSDQSGDRLERRRHPRIGPKGSIIFRTPGYEQPGRIANVSQSGMYILTAVTAPDHLVGCAVEIEVRLDAGKAEWLTAKGRIVRIAPEGLAMMFDEPLAPLLHMIDEQTTASHARSRVIAVVLIDADERRRSAMAAGFRSTGCTIVEASTPLEAIVRLGESSFEPDVIAVADSSSDAAEQMRAFVERDHPNVKLIRIGDELLRPDGFANWLSSSNPDADLPDRVRQALVTPRRRR